jgi:ADP-heptose:LPS heptosyltransferase
MPFAYSETVAGVLKSPRKILLVKQAERLGNIVLLNSAISALKKQFPDSEIDLLLPAKFAATMNDDKRITTVIPVYKKIYISRPWKLAGLLRTLRKRRYDLAVDCSDVNSHSSTGIAYTLLSGARVTAGWNIGRIFDLETPRYNDITHASSMYLRLLSGIFGREFEGDPYFDSGPPEKRPKPLVGINCGGRNDKRWPLENFIRLGEILSENNISAEYILGPDEEAQRKFLQDNMPPLCSLLPLIPVARLKDTFRKYSAFVTSDSGPMHIAWSLKIPVIAIFLSSEMEKFKPLSEGSICFDGSGELNPQEVYQMVLSALDSERISA